MSFLFNKPTEKEIMRQNDRQLRAANRNLSTDFRQLEQKERELEAQIKALAKKGQKDVCEMLAKQLVQLRKQKSKNVSMGALITSTSAKNRQMNSMNAMTKAIGTSAQTMTSVNNKLPIGEFAKTMRDFTYANDKMDMQSEMIEETLDSMLDTDQDEEDKIINQVLDEIGIEMNTKLANVPKISDSLPAQSEPSSARGEKNVDLEKMLADLRK